jgi:large subunit ribosomal protein L14
MFIGSHLKCIDNTGARLVKCIQKYKLGRIIIGDTVLVVVKKLLPNKKVTKGQKFKAIVVCANHLLRRRGGLFLKCDLCAVILLKKNGEMLGTRIRDPVLNELRLFNRVKILSLSPYVI